MKWGFLVDPVNGHTIVELPENLDGYYKMLDCRLIDVVSCKIGNKYYDIVHDDEGLYADNALVSAVDGSGQPMLVGKLLICNHDGEGNEAGLTQDDILNIEANTMQRFYIRGDY